LVKSSEQSPSDYDLSVDAQTENFLELKQKLTYFLITASVAPIAFALTLLQDRLSNLDQAGYLLATFVPGVVCGLLSSGSALRAIYCEMESYRLHIASRYARKTWQDLPVKEQNHWDKLNRSASLYLEASFITLFTEFALLSVCGTLLLVSETADKAMPIWRLHFW
jgi:hypothetical protein